MRGFSPSSADRWTQCPGSVLLSQPFYGAGIVQSESAKEGEAAHWVAEQLARGVTELPEETPTGYPIDAEMISGGQIWAEFLKGHDAKLEQKYTCSSVHPQMGGMRVDASFEDAETLTVADYKYGFEYVDADENMQLLASVAGLDFHRFKNLNLVIVQPRAIGESVIKSWRLSVEEYETKWLPFLQACAKEVVADTPTSNTGSHCKYCPARHACKAMAMASRTSVEVSRNATSLDLDAAAMSQELALLMDAAERLKHRISGLEAQVILEIEKSGSVPGFQLEPSYSNLAWVADIDKILAAAKIVGINILRPQEAITPTQAKKAGLPDSVVSRLAKRNFIGNKLKRVNMNALRKAFKNG